MGLVTSISFWLIVLAIWVLCRFLPTLIAWRRGHPQTSSIFTLDLLAGNTGLGWALAYLWARSDSVEVRYDGIPITSAAPPLTAGRSSQMPADYVSAAEPMFPPVTAAYVIPESRREASQATDNGAMIIPTPGRAKFKDAAEEARDAYARNRPLGGGAW
ncbi:MAG: superinfection immunity protein [Rhizobiales bacterium]|nr:superinfection immunity protein [Hyphomicrobiales bacterium]